MSKKTSKRKTSREGAVAVARPSITTDIIKTPISTATSRSVEFKPDYTYVIKDLRRIGVLAGSFFGVLIALAIILPMILHY